MPVLLIGDPSCHTTHMAAASCALPRACMEERGAERKLHFAFIAGISNAGRADEDRDCFCFLGRAAAASKLTAWECEWSPWVSPVWYTLTQP